MKNKLYKLAIILILASLFLFISITNIKAKSGCCSWHEGVCGCDTSVGRQVCCDGTYSPSCKCTYIPSVKKPTPVPTRRPTPTEEPTLRPTKICTPTMHIITNNSSNPDNSIIGWLILIALVGGGYYLYKKAEK